MTGYTKLIAPIEPGGGTELERLARCCNTTAKMLGELAVRQLFVAAQAEALPILPPLDPAITGGLGLWLNEADRAALDALAERLGTTAVALASLAVRHMLAHAREGALPMAVPLTPDTSDLSEEPASAIAARLNFSKAIYTIARLSRLAVEGIDPRDPLGPLKDIAQLRESPPY